MSGEPAVSREILDFASVMTTRQRSFDEQLGTNNFLTNTTAEEALHGLKCVVEQLEGLLSAKKDTYSDTHVTTYVDKTEKEIIKDNITAKTVTADAGNWAMILWTKL